MSAEQEGTPCECRERTIEECAMMPSRHCGLWNAGDGSIGNDEHDAGSTRTASRASGVTASPAFTTSGANVIYGWIVGAYAGGALIYAITEHRPAVYALTALGAIVAIPQVILSKKRCPQSSGASQ